MCFVISRRETADKDIICYKILIEDNDGVLRSPYYLKIWELGEEQTEKLTQEKVQLKGKEYELKTATGLYTFDNKRSARIALDIMKERTKVNFRLFKCIIPKGSKYYIGSHYRNEYCSEKLIIKRKLIFNLI